MTNADVSRPFTRATRRWRGTSARSAATPSTGPRPTRQHHEQDYPLVRRCPRCGGVAVISLISAVDDPVWECKTNPHHDYADSFFDQEDFDD